MGGQGALHAPFSKGGMTMDAATITVLIGTALFIGLIVWLRFYAPREEAGNDTTPSNSAAEKSAVIETPAGERRRKSR
jgi:hypothetical protein